MEGFEGEGAADVPDVRGEHGGAQDWDAGVKCWAGVVATGEDAVLVDFAAGAVTSVEAYGGELGGGDADAGWEVVVEGSEEVGGGDEGVELYGSDLGVGVDTGVGAAGALGEDGLSGDVKEGGCEGSLDGGERRLDLPAVEGGSVVGEDELPEWHESALDGITEWIVARRRRLASEARAKSVRGNVQWLIYLQVSNTETFAKERERSGGELRMELSAAAEWKFQGR